MSDVIFFKNLNEFNDWLEENSGASEIWVGYFKKVQGEYTLLGLHLSMLHSVLGGLTVYEKP